MRQHNSSRRLPLKRWLIENIGAKVCPICGHRAPTDLHEIVAVQSGGSKYDKEYPSELCVLLCNECNVRIGGGKAYQAQLLAYNAADERFGVEAVIAAIQDVEAKTPLAWRPNSLTVNGVTYPIPPSRRKSDS